MVNDSKRIGIDYYSYDPSHEEIEILLETLKPGKKLPPLIYSIYSDQLIAEHYLNELLEGKNSLV